MNVLRPKNVFLKELNPSARHEYQLIGLIHIIFVLGLFKICGDINCSILSYGITIKFPSQM